MAQMQATAVITAVDRASPVFARVAQAAHQAANVYTGVAGRMDAVAASMRTAMSAMALPSVAALGMLIQKTQEFEKALVGVQIAGIADNMKDRVVDFEKIREAAKGAQEEAMRLSKALSLAPTGFVKSAEAALKMGLSAEKVTKLMEMSGSVHIQDNAISQDKATEFLGTVGIQFGAGTKGRDYNDDITKFANQWLAVANMTRTSASKLEEGLRQFAPLYASLGESFSDTASLVGAMTQAGLMDTESGTALKSAANRFLNMTHTGRDSMLVSGLWDEIQKNKLIDMSAATSRQAMLNLKQLFAGRISKKDENPLRDLLEQGERGKLFMDSGYQQQLFAHLNKLTSANDAPTMEANQEKVLTAIMTGGGHIQMTKILQLMAKMQAEGKLTDAQLGKIFEGRHIARYKALFMMMGELEKLQKATSGVTDEFTKAGNKIWNESDAGRWAATVASFDRALIKLRQSDGVRSLVSAFEQIAQAFAAMPPGMSEFAGKALAASVAIGALGIAFSALSKAALVVMANPLLRGLFLGGAALGLFAPDAFMGADRLDKNDLMDPSMFGPGAPIWQTVDRFKELGTEIGKSFDSATDGIANLIREVQILFGQDPSGSPFLRGLAAINSVVENLTNGVRRMRTDLSGETKMEWEPGLVDGWLSRYRNWLKSDRTDLSPSLLRDIPGGATPFGGRQQAEARVTGEASVKVQNEVVVRVEGPGVVISNTPGTGNATVPLNTGRTMPDIGSGSGTKFGPR